MPIFPGSEARPFANFREIWDNLSPSQQQSAVGKSAYQLIREGVVDFKDVVSPTHVLTLQEVVAENRLTIDAMTKAGVRPDIAKAAHDAANTPAAVLDEQRRKTLIERIKGAGVAVAQIRDMVGRLITERVSIKEGPSGPQGMPSPRKGPPDVQPPMTGLLTGLPPALLSLLSRYNIPSLWRPRPKPEPEPDEEE